MFPDMFQTAMRFFYFCFFCAAFATLAACHAAKPVSVSQNPVSINDRPTTNQPLPPSKPLGEMSWTIFDGKTNADGSEQKLKNLQGKAVILDFWATYCPPCIAEIPHLKELQAKYGKDNLVVVGLHVGAEDDRPKVPAFVEKLKIDYPLATPEDGLISFIFNNNDSIPQTAVFDRNGILIEKFIGFGEQTKIDLDSAVSRAVQN